MSNTWKKYFVHKADLLENTKFTKLANMGAFDVSPERAKKFVTYFCDLLSCPQNDGKIPRVEVFTKTGWTDDGSKFIYPTDRDGDCPVINQAADYDKLFAKKGDAKDWVKEYLYLVHRNSACRLILGAALAALLQQPLGVRNLQMHVWGTSGSGKSAVTKFAMSTYGKCDDSYPTLRNTFNGTNNFFDTINSKFNDLPLYVDEFQIHDVIRRLNIGANRVIPETEIKEKVCEYEQLSLFDDYEKQTAEKEAEKKLLEKERALQEATLSIKKRFGKNAILKGLNYEPGATAIERNGQIGGHKA